MSGPSMAAANSHSKNDDEQRSGVPLPTNEEEWTSYIEESSHVDGRSPSVVSIFRVPGTLMEVSKNRGAYVPQRVSLGPYHHGSGQLAPMEYHKPRALCRMMRKFNRYHRSPNNMDFAVRARNAIVQVQEVIKNNYDGKVKYEGEILATMLTLDGCFILEIMRALFMESSISEGYDPLFEINKLNLLERDLVADILKLENQIPLIVLQKLLQLQLQRDDVTDTLCEMVLRFLFIFYPFGDEGKEACLNDYHLLSIFKQRLLLEDQGHHLLEFFRTLVFAPFGDPGNNSVSIEVVVEKLIPTVHRQRSGAMMNTPAIRDRRYRIGEIAAKVLLLPVGRTRLWNKFLVINYRVHKYFGIGKTKWAVLFHGMKSRPDILDPMGTQHFAS